VKDYASIATQYARDVCAGNIPACKWVRLACQRHLSDLERSESEDESFPYVFNPELTAPDSGKPYRPADRVCYFAELMPHVKGVWASRGELIRLEPWQVFVLASIFGWIHRGTLMRRFTKADLFVPRKNAKSAIAAVIALYLFAADGEYGAEVYSGATSERQAGEVFLPAKEMARKSPEFRARFGVLVGAKNIVVLDTNSKFERLIGKPGDGASPHGAIHDEYHEHPTSEQYDAMATGMGARTQPLQLVITTAGVNIGGPCHYHQKELEKILQGTDAEESSDHRWGIIYTIDDDDDWTDPQVLRKANPNLGVSINAENLRLDHATAVRDPRKATIFRTKHLNQWVGAANSWLNLPNLLKSVDKTLRLEQQFEREENVVGLDLASKTDVASKAMVFEREIEGVMHYYVFWRHWLPAAAIQKPENDRYRGWLAGGHVVQTPGNMIDLKRIEADVVNDNETYPAREVAMDAWGSREIAPSLTDEGLTVVDVPMQTRHLSAPMKTIAALIDGGRMHLADDPPAIWMLSNVECYEDRNENVFPRKPKPELKIDAAVALIVAMSRVIVPEEESGGTVYEELARLRRQQQAEHQGAAA
jgi:phage terminase large subunit-like protein